MRFSICAGVYMPCFEHRSLSLVVSDGTIFISRNVEVLSRDVN